MPNVPDFAAKGQDVVAKAVDSVLDTVKEQADRTTASFERVVELVPTPTEVLEQVTATANELLSLSQDIQNKVVAALTSNA